MAPLPPVKDVEALLLRERKRRRRPGDVPYPAKASLQLTNHDIWDQMFYSSCCKRSLTMFQFEKPPAVVLDLGCGSGYWCLEAAKQWTSSTIIGFDLQDIQPPLFDLDTHKDLARRVKWVHGNLLDGLPFPPDHFDFVRIARVGLAIPEDEWQYVLEEVARTMKLGAPVEILEEDLIFPCAEIQPVAQPTHRASDATPIRIELPVTEPSRTSTYSSRQSTTDPWHLSFDDIEFGAHKSKGGLPTLQESPPGSLTYSSYTIGNYNASMFGTQSALLSPTASDDPTYDEARPQDHTKLRAAWDSMLSKRFLSSQLLSVLPFYLSSCFDEVQSHPTLEIPLPPNSPSFNGPKTDNRSSIHSDGMIDVGSQFAMASGAGRRSGDADPVPVSQPTDVARDAVPFWANMHLAKVVETIVSCKEAIWAEYEHQNQPKAEEIRHVVRTVRQKNNVRLLPSTYNVREEFDNAWSNWHNDMADRINMRGTMASHLGWNEPQGERPDWRIWRDNVDLPIEIAAPPTPVSETGRSSYKPNLCRAIKGFVAWKH
ncbi:hypothetical protein CYLTODRAFT_422673 [Cylindrobasidium torrendii FP15055 ss-10]|uniref:Methyltransferase domain-containing protein n=1 Tax=Cylindrobasidium torrendii FP15055 ss-10 TaxID=1314674 RepID=A0A0D7B9S4_9AGAR|nr:hypothetical protein CYLTODRAFT_422673 [Cylindrobasidium torrendii FP15055 ss-10]